MLYNCFIECANSMNHLYKYFLLTCCAIFNEDSRRFLLHMTKQRRYNVSIVWNAVYGYANECLCLPNNKNQCPGVASFAWYSQWCSIGKLKPCTLLLILLWYKLISGVTVTFVGVNDIGVRIPLSETALESNRVLFVCLNVNNTLWYPIITGSWRI